MARTDYIPEELFQQILSTLMPANALALQTMMDTGMRISDCLEMRRADLEAAGRAAFPVYEYTESKTGKRREARIPADTYQALLAMSKRSGLSPFVFAGRDPGKHRTRQAVWKDLHRAASLWRVNGRRLKANLGTHSARKVYAVKLFREAKAQGLYDPLAVVQVDMNHKDPAVTFLYAMADVISKRRGN